MNEAARRPLTPPLPLLDTLPLHSALRRLGLAALPPLSALQRLGLAALELASELRYLGLLKPDLSLLLSLLKEEVESALLPHLTSSALLSLLISSAEFLVLSFNLGAVDELPSDPKP